MNFSNEIDLVHTWQKPGYGRGLHSRSQRHWSNQMLAEARHSNSDFYWRIPFYWKKQKRIIGCCTFDTRQLQTRKQKSHAAARTRQSLPTTATRTGAI